MQCWTDCWLKSLLSKPFEFFLRNRRLLLLLLLVLAVVLLTSGTTVLLMKQANTPHPLPSSTPKSSDDGTSQTLTSTPQLTNTLMPTLVPSPTPQTTYAKDEKQYHSYGNVYVTGVEIYAGNLEGNQIKWGTLYPGDSKNFTFYLRSTSNVPIMLALSVTDWEPAEISSFLSLSWNYNQTIISPNQGIFLTFTLRLPLTPAFEAYLVNNNIVSFNFNIHIYSTKY